MAGLVAALLVALIAVVVWSIVQRRALIGRIDLLADRIDTDGLGGGGDAQRALTRIARGLERSEESVARASAAAELMQRALDRLPEGVVIVDADGRQVAVNAAARGMAGTHHGDAIVFEAIEALADGARNGDPRDRTIELNGPPRRTLNIRAIPFDAPGTAGRGALVVAEDVTERQRLEDVRTDFVANVSHELKTPIGAIALLAETLGGEDDPDVVARLAARIQSEALRVGNLITDLMELSWIETGDQARPAAVRVRRVLNESIDRVRELAEQRSITIDRDEVHPKLAVAGDRRQLVSAVGNLLENAVRYSDPGTSVEISTSSSGGLVEIRVTDHGIGIPARDLDRVFERFYRVDRARSRETGGTGLGLSIVRHVADNHRGTVAVTSVEGQGSTFTLRLPTADGPNLEVAEAG
ncbi:MAG: sensor histidine kinase [Acidimicrobiia bacterium]